MTGKMILDVPPAQVRQYGLGRIIMYARQKAINRVFGAGLSGHVYFNSAPLVTESAFEYLAHDGMTAPQLAALAFQTFSQPDAELDSNYIYQRLNGPNDTVLALTLGETLSILSGRQIRTAVLNTGMSAFTALFDLLRPGDMVFYNPVIYGCTKNKIVTHLPKMGIKVVADRLDNLMALRQKLLATKSARMIVTETELNPTLEIPPIDELANMVDEVNAKRLAKGWRPVILVADNTFPTFANMNVFGLGVHCVIESMTKFICGTGENMGGFVAVDMEQDFHLGDEDYGSLHNFLMMMQKDDGLSLAPFPAWDITRNLSSIEMRRAWVQSNAQGLAENLINHPKVQFVAFPGITGNSTQDDRAHRLMVDESGKFSPGYMIYFGLKGTPDSAKEKGARVLDWLGRNTSLRVKVSFGQQETNVEHPPTMTHSSYSREECDAAGIDQGGIRVAVGWDKAPYISDSIREALEEAT